MAKTPYKYWSRNDLFWKIKQQALDYRCCHPDMLYTIRSAAYDTRWNPAKDFNGCTFVQDDLHPFLPCFIHDWRWVTRQDVKLADLEFRENLLHFGYPKWKANLYYYTVRLAYICYYQFAHKK